MLSTPAMKNVYWTSASCKKVTRTRPTEYRYLIHLLNYIHSLLTFWVCCSCDIIVIDVAKNGGDNSFWSRSRLSFTLDSDRKLGLLNLVTL